MKHNLLWNTNNFRTQIGMKSELWLGNCDETHIVWNTIHILMNCDETQIVTKHNLSWSTKYEESGNNSKSAETSNYEDSDSEKFLFDKTQTFTKSNFWQNFILRVLIFWKN